MCYKSSAQVVQSVRVQGSGPPDPFVEVSVVYTGALNKETVQSLELTLRVLWYSGLG